MIGADAYEDMAGSYQRLLETTDQVCRNRAPANAERLRASVQRLGDLIQRTDPAGLTPGDVAALSAALRAALDQLDAATADFQPSWRYRFRRLLGLPV